MKKYVAFLRGINVGGKNKIPMAELKEGFESLGFRDVKTCLNSGNVVFSSDQEHPEPLAGQIEAMIKKRFAWEVPVCMIPQEKLVDILSNAPDWWGRNHKEIYDNLIFIIPPTTFDEVFREIGEPKEGLETIKNYKNAIFWSFDRKNYQKTNWWPKTAGANVSSRLTIRTANTVRKLAGI